MDSRGKCILDGFFFYPVELFPPLLSIGHAPQAGWDVPEADVGVLGLHAEIHTA